jgi:hypothetical protein
MVSRVIANDLQLHILLRKASAPAAVSQAASLDRHAPAKVVLR